MHHILRRYTGDAFTQNHDIVYDWCHTLNDNHFKFVQSNSDTDYILEIYGDFNIDMVKTGEVAISNFE